MARIIRGPGVNSMSCGWADARLDMNPTIKTANICCFMGELLEGIRILGVLGRYPTLFPHNYGEAWVAMSHHEQCAQAAGRGGIARVAPALPRRLAIRFQPRHSYS